MKRLKLSFIVLGLSLGSTAFAKARGSNAVDPGRNGRATVKMDKAHNGGKAGCNQTVNYANKKQPSLFQDTRAKSTFEKEAI